MTESQTKFSNIFEQRFGVRVEGLIGGKTKVFVDNERPNVAVQNDGNDDIVIYHNISKEQLELLQAGKNVNIFSRTTCIYSRRVIGDIISAMKQVRLFD